MWSVAAVAAACLLPSGGLALTVGTAAKAKASSQAKKMETSVAAKFVAHRSSRSHGGGFVEPMHFDQQLLICNAYPSASPATVLKNGKEALAGGDKADVGYQQCRYIPARVQKHDRLDFGLRDTEVEGSFEVGDLPATDAVLLLVLQRHADSSTIGFQSFAFPKSSDRKDAQLAVINAFSGNASSPHLKMEDHISGKEVKTVAKRIEQLNFNRVYSVEAGEYDASIVGGAAAAAEQKTRRLVKMSRSENYVVLRTGGGDFAESLVVFPEPVLHSAAPKVAASSALLMALVMALLSLLSVA